MLQFKTSGRGSHKETQTGPRTVGGPVERNAEEGRNQERIKKNLIYRQKSSMDESLDSKSQS